MPLHPYHNNLSRWFRQYIFDLTNDIHDSQLWTKFQYINSPGWTLVHLIVEGELAIIKIKPDYKISPSVGAGMENYKDFMYGSGGDAKLDLSTSELLDRFKDVYKILETEVSGKMDMLYSREIDDEALKGVLKTELDFYLHMLTTHIAMHCDALIKWRLNAGMKRPYE